MKKIRGYYLIPIIVLICFAGYIHNKTSMGEITKVSVSRDFKLQTNDSQIIDEEAIAMSGQIQTEETYEIAAKEVFEILNKQRKEAGLYELIWSEELKNAAKVRATEIEVLFSHSRPDGTEWWTVNSILMYGENLAKNFNSAKSVMEAWNASPTHKANVMDASFKTVGIAIFCGSDGEWYWAQEFGY